MKRLLAVLSTFALLCGCTAAPAANIPPTVPGGEGTVSSSGISPAPPVAASSVASQDAISSSVTDKAVPEESVEPVSAVPEVLSLSTSPQGFALDPLEVHSIRVYRYNDQVSVMANQETVLAVLTRLQPVETKEELGKAVSGVDFMTIQLGDETKYTFTFYADGMTAELALPGKSKGAPTAYRVDAAPYGELIAHLREQLDTGNWASSWLSNMRASLVQNIKITSADGTDQEEFVPGCTGFSSLFATLQRLRVTPDTLQTMLPNTLHPGAITVSMDFSTGVQYIVQLDGKHLWVNSSDMSYALQYQTDQDPADLESFLRAEKIAPLTGKPVIYLYPTQRTDISVKLHFKGDLLYTYPAYENGWQVTAYPDGRLVNKADGSTHYYLFWDGSSATDWQFPEGFVIKGTDTQAFLTEKLAYMGLTPREYNDFIVYWLPMMQQNPYNLITFSTEQYEALAPLEISPAPDSILRVHMVYRPLSAPVEIPPQTLQTFTRKGFTVVEWGGSRG